MVVARLRLILWVSAFLSVSAYRAKTPLLRLFGASAGGTPRAWGRRSALTDDASAMSPAPLPEDTAIAERAIIVGGGPTGLLSAIALARRGYPRVDVFERLPEPPAVDSEEWGGLRSYNIGVNGRGQRALERFGCLDALCEWSAGVQGRFDWSPEAPEGAERIYNRTYTSRVVQRDRLVSILLKEATEKYPRQINVRHGLSCKDIVRDVGTGELEVSFEGENGEKACAKGDLVIGADGVQSAVRDLLAAEANVKVRKYKATNTRVYRIVKLQLPGNWRRDYNSSYRGKSGITLDALPTKEGLLVGVVLFRPGDERVEGLKTGRDVKAFFEEHFPKLAPFVEDGELAAFATRATSKLPSFSYAFPRLHSENAVILGDAIHTVKPYFGQGVNSAFEDVTVLDDCLESSSDVPEALERFSRARAPEAKALVRMSKLLDGGFLTFVLPIILDGIFNKVAPRIFRPNTISMMQMENLKFTQVARRKRIDRALQAALGSAFLAGAAHVLWLLAKSAFCLGKKAMTLAAVA